MPPRASPFPRTAFHAVGCPSRERSGGGTLPSIPGPGPVADPQPGMVATVRNRRGLVGSVRESEGP